MIDFTKFTIAKSFRHLDPNQWAADGISAGFSSIRYKGKIWSLNHGGKNYLFRRDTDNTPLSYIDVVILGSSRGKSRVYFGREYDEDSTSAPICASLRGVVPDPGVPIPQSKSCDICSHDEWITKPNGQRSKECQEHKRLAVLLMPNMTAKMFKTSLFEPIYLKLPPGSFKSWKLYADEFIAENIPMGGVVTRISFTEDRLFELKFDIVEALSDAEAGVVLPLMENPQTKLILGGMAAFKEINPPSPSPERKPERASAGLLSAFGAKKPVTIEHDENEDEDEDEAPPAPPAPKRGRPKGAVNKPRGEAETEVRAAPEPVAEPVEPVEAATNIDSGDYEESDPDIDASIAKIVSDKMSNFMK